MQLGRNESLRRQTVLRQTCAETHGECLGKSLVRLVKQRNLGVPRLLVILRLPDVVLLRTRHLHERRIEIFCYNGGGIRCLREIPEQQHELVT